jgi:hypothetical protein
MVYRIKASIIFYSGFKVGVFIGQVSISRESIKEHILKRVAPFSLTEEKSEDLVMRGGECYANRAYPLP